MRKITGQLAEGVELFALLFEAGYLADAIEQHGDAALSHRRQRAQHLGKDLPVEIESPGVGDDKPCPPCDFMREKGRSPVICPARPIKSPVGALRSRRT